MLFFSAHTGKQSNNSAALLCDQLTWIRYIDKSSTLLTKSYISDQVNLPLVVHAGLCLTWLKTPDMPVFSCHSSSFIIDLINHTHLYYHLIISVFCFRLFQGNIFNNIWLGLTRFMKTVRIDHL